MAEIKKSIWIDAPPEVVFEYFVNPEKMQRWCGRKAELDPVPGGMYKLDMGNWGIVEGCFVKIAPPHFVSHTVPSGAEEEDDQGSLIEISITADAGGSQVDIRQTGLKSPMDLVAARGLEHHLARLSVAATGGAPGPDSMCAKNMTVFL